MAKAKAKEKKLISIKDLKTWLDGYCSAHGDDWSPTPEQWKMIKTKIFALDDTAPTAPTAPVAHAGYGTSVQVPRQSYLDMGANSDFGRPSTFTSPEQVGMIRDVGMKTPNKEANDTDSAFA